MQLLDGAEFPEFPEFPPISSAGPTAQNEKPDRTALKEKTARDVNLLSTILPNCKNMGLKLD